MAAASDNRAPAEALQKEVPWTTVLGRKARKVEKSASENLARPAPPAPGKPGGGATRQPPKAAPRLPRSAGPPAITLTAPVGGGEWTVARAMAKLREEVPLEDLNIEGVRPKLAATGGLILEIPGPNGAEKADRLAERMRGALEGTGMRVARPYKRAELRVRDLVDSTTPALLASVLARAGECPEGDVRVGNMTRRSPKELGTAWVQVPLTAAKKVLSGGRLRVGWELARVEVLDSRPLQCFRCLAPGHTRVQCTSEVDRSDRCYRCGQPGHRATNCSSAPNCPLCADSGRPSGHRCGAPSCLQRTPNKKGGDGPAKKQKVTTRSETEAIKPPGKDRQEEAATKPHK